jgi:LysR family transcriptional regulator, transcriptional activator of nhaA
MEWLNYHHLLYFWTVVREGSISQASRKLRLAQPTISAQLHSLEDQLGEKLFQRSGRKLELTEIGRIAYSYADEIFTLGRELTDTLKSRPSGRPVRLTVGISDALPKVIAYHLLEPALRLQQLVHLVCLEGKTQQLLTDLMTHELDLVLSDAPAGPESHVKAYNHLLGECGIQLFGTADLIAPLKKEFPKSLEGAPMIMPVGGTALRRSLDQWFERQSIRPRIVAEMADSALLKVFGAAGKGLFPVPAAIGKEICRQYNVRVLGALDDVHERFYAISVERKLKNPAVVAISESARTELFAQAHPY